MSATLTSILDFIKDFGKPLKVWMKFLIIVMVIQMAFCYVFNVDVNKAISAINANPVTEMYIQPERVAEVDSILNRLSSSTGSEGAYVFAYLPMYAIKSSSLLQIYEVKGVDYLNFENFSNVPITIDGEWFLKMKAGEQYHRTTQPDGIYSGMYSRGVREFYSYPVIGKHDILYGNITIAFSKEPTMSDDAIRAYLRVAAAGIVEITGK